MGFSGHVACAALWWLLLQVPETLQYHVVRNMSRSDMTIVDSIVEAPGILQAKPKLTGE
jgi:hypothetical protein